MEWNKRWFELAEHFASWSKDRSRGVGAVIVNDDKRLLSFGYNGFPMGINDSINNRYYKPDKYIWTEHAERNAIYSASRLGVSLVGGTIYTTLFPCAGCTRAIIQAGISKVYSPEPNWNDEKYGQEWKAAVQMLKEAKLEYYEVGNDW